MQLMTWPLARLGSRFGLLFEPHRRRVLHSALGRFLDAPLDLAVGFIEPDGTERMLPFTQSGTAFYAVEQFERVNSITYRGHSDTCGVRFELNFHSPFYPQNEKLCIMPVIYVELRVSPVARVRLRSFRESPSSLKLFIRMRRPDTHIDASPGRIDLRYQTTLDPVYESALGGETSGSSKSTPHTRTANVVERLQSLNENATPTQDDNGGIGLTLDLPVTQEGMGIKWRLVWAAHTADPILETDNEPAQFRYLKHWPDLDSVMQQAIETRDDNLLLSRRFEKILEQAPLGRAAWHLLVMAFQSYLADTYWCQTPDGNEIFTVVDGNSMRHNPVETGYITSPFYYAVWPRLLDLQLRQWLGAMRPHQPSNGAILCGDLGSGLRIRNDTHTASTPVTDNADLLLILQAHAHWTGRIGLIKRHAEQIANLARYLLWTDTESTGFPAEGVYGGQNTSGVSPRFARRLTHLAIKRAAALMAAADILGRIGDTLLADQCRTAAAEAAPRIESASWQRDHYVVSADPDARSQTESWSNTATVALRQSAGWDAYSIHTADALLLPAMTGQPPAFDSDHLRVDLWNAHRENLRAYGCGNTSDHKQSIWISQNLWRDHLGRYLHVDLPEMNSRYWDMLTAANVGEQSFGFIDTYIANELAFNPRGVSAMGIFLSGPRLVIDRLDGEFMAVDPDRHRPARWPLLALADWEAGRVPVCVVDDEGQVSIEAEIEPVKITGRIADGETDVIG